jgi:alpha-L-fucosidase
MKYIVFVAKHWDGFCEWPTKTTDYNIGNSPFKRDVCGELAKEAHKQGLKIGWYFCPADMHDVDCQKPTNDKYIERMRGQLTELLTNYGKIDIMWFDYAAPPEVAPWDQENTYALVRKLQPGIIINNRLDMVTMGDYWAQKVGPNADYYTPEQRIGGYDDKTPWETNMTIGDQWAYRPHDNIKSTAECIRTLALCVGGDGNFLFNVGPTPLGEIEPPQPQRLKEIGDWLKTNGESIYGTRGGPFKPNSAVASTRKGDVIYVHVLKPQAGPLALPPIPRKIKSAALLTGGKVSFKQSAEGITLDIPNEAASSLDTIVKLKLDGSAMDIPAVAVPDRRESELK